VSAAVVNQDAAIVFLQADSGEWGGVFDGNDGDRYVFSSSLSVRSLDAATHHRNNLTAWSNGDALVQAVAANNSNTIVVVNSVGPLILEPWIDNPNVTAVLWAGLGGTESGNALVDVLYGVLSPSGRLPFTIAKSPSDYPAQIVTGGTGDEIVNIAYSEGCVVSLPTKL
jgi:hypothetical protein